MSEEKQPDPQPRRSIPIYLSGPMPHGAVWCAVCVMIYMGTISFEPELQAYAKELTEAAIDAGASLVSIDLAERDDLQLQPAITVGPSWMYRVPDAGAFDPVTGQPAYKHPELPVCWTHIQGIPPKTQDVRTRQAPQGSTLIRGKAYRTRR